jgi:hypothetical protein
MTSRSVRSVADELGEWDGIDPREEKKHRIRASSKKPAYSVLRLAGEIRNVLNIEIPNSGNTILATFLVGRVEPYGIGPNFVVQVHSTDGSLKYDPREIKAELAKMKPSLRSEVVRSVNRKKAPDFKFDVLPPGVQPR